MTLPRQEAAWPERLGSGGAGLGCDQENTGSKGRKPEGASGRERPRVPGKQGQARKTDCFTQVGHAPRGPRLTSLLPLSQTGPQPLTAGASEEEAGSSRASRGNSDAGDPQRLRTRQESGGRRC